MSQTTNQTKYGSKKAVKFKNRSLKSWLEKNDVEMYSTHIEGKSVVAERIIRTLKKKNYKYIASVSKNLYIDELDDIFNRYSNTYHSTVKRSLLMKSQAFMLTLVKKIIKKDPKFEVNGQVRLSKYRNIFAKGYLPNCSEEL